MSSHLLKIATRDSTLALWQTNAVKARLEKHGFPCKLIPLKTLGDINLVEPLYAMGVQGVFTKELDSALLSHQADAAVHSLKDVPTILPIGLGIAAVMERASYEDVLIHKPGFAPSPSEEAIIATSSIRRKSQWLNRFPKHALVNVRGNVETRMRKFKEEGWDGIIFAKAGLERLGLMPRDFTVLDWMVPAPAQGAIAIVCRKDDERVFQACRNLNHEPSEIRVNVERDFLYHLEGGCSVPISALATINKDKILFRGMVSSLDGAREVRTEKTGNKQEWKKIGLEAAKEIRQSEEGKKILGEFRKLNRTNS